MENEWIDIPGYPLYKLNHNTYDILSLNEYRGTNKRTLKKSYSHGYIVYRLKNESKKYKSLGLHRIVMLIKEGPCPEGMIVCHNDGNKLNNHPDNLRYDTYSSNTLDSIKHGTYPKNYKKVNQYTLDGEFIREWSSIKLASNSLGIHCSGISGCVRGFHNKFKGYKWSYTNITQ